MYIIKCNNHTWKFLHEVLRYKWKCLFYPRQIDLDKQVPVKFNSKQGRDALSINSFYFTFRTTFFIHSNRFFTIARCEQVCSQNRTCFSVNTKHKFYCPSLKYVVFCLNSNHLVVQNCQSLVRNQAQMQLFLILVQEGTLHRGRDKKKNKICIN